MVILADGNGGGIAPTQGATVDAALSGSGEADAKLAEIEQKVARDPKLRRKNGESLKDWSKRIGAVFLLDQTLQRRLMMRALYTEGQLSLSARKTSDMAEFIEASTADRIDRGSKPGAPQSNTPYERNASGIDPLILANTPFRA